MNVKKSLEHIWKMLYSINRSPLKEFARKICLKDNSVGYWYSYCFNINGIKMTFIRSPYAECWIKYMEGLMMADETIPCVVIQLEKVYNELLLKEKNIQDEYKIAICKGAYDGNK
jgi:hypothetical protein